MTSTILARSRSSVVSLESLSPFVVQSRHKIAISPCWVDSRVEFIRLECFDDLEAFADCHIDLCVRRKTWANIYTVTIWQSGVVMRCATFESAFKCVQFCNSAVQHLLDTAPLF